ncbi:MAG TPA: metalloregulator ArsR/SmtB family transcription factor [Acidimicrobiales bacterium]|nr:metalloregulator ArsR/SmtB family transcription factor [Acidimicrobiales bacterium]
MTVTTADRLSSTFAALGDPTRRAIVERLAEGEATVNELAEPFAMSLQAVSKHLKVLEKAGLVVRTRSAQRRPARLAAGALGEAGRWLEGYQAFFEESYERLEEHLAGPEERSRPTPDRSKSNERGRGTP